MPDTSTVSVEVLDVTLLPGRRCLMGLAQVEVTLDDVGIVLQGVTGNTGALMQSFVSQQTQDTVAAINNSGQGVRDEIASLRREMQQMIRGLTA